MWSLVFTRNYYDNLAWFKNRKHTLLVLNMQILKVSCLQSLDYTYWHYILTISPNPGIMAKIKEASESSRTEHTKIVRVAEGRIKFLYNCQEQNVNNFICIHGKLNTTNLQLFEFSRRHNRCELCRSSVSLTHWTNIIKYTFV